MSDEQMDDETLAMLDELEGEKTEREQLEARADALGVKYRGNTGDDTIRDRIAEAEAVLATDGPEPTPAPPKDKAITVRNPRRNRLVIGSISLAHDEAHTLTDTQMDDDRIRAKVARAVELGILVEG